MIGVTSGVTGSRFRVGFGVFMLYYRRACALTLKQIASRAAAALGLKIRVSAVRFRPWPL